MRRGDSDSDNTRAESPAAGGKGTASLWSDSGRSSASVLKVLVRCRRCGQDVRAFVTVASTPSDQAQGQACPADRLELELELKSNQTRRGAAVQTLLLCMLRCLYVLFCTLARFALPLLCLAAVLQPTALPSVEITKLDSHLRYCTLTATPPAFHHSAQAATPMPVASLRLLTRLPRQLPCQACSATDTPRRAAPALARCVREEVCKAGFSPASHVRSAGCIPP